MGQVNLWKNTENKMTKKKKKSLRLKEDYPSTYKS